MSRNPELTTHRDSSESKLAVLFVHGYGGHPAKTWGRFPDLLMTLPALEGWDVYSFGYPTGFAFDLVGIWKADPPLDSLADQLRTRSAHAPLDRYDGLALVAHSMGGLIAQRALVDDEELVRKVSHVVLFATPSGGLIKALLARFWKRQLENMAKGGPFVQDVRRRWKAQFGDNPPFRFAVVGGSKDEFVPRESSVEPFPEHQRLMVAGDHLTLVKPTETSDMSVQILESALTGDAKEAGPIRPAGYVAERQAARATVERLGRTPDLDERGLVDLALALEYLGEQDRAIEELERRIRDDYTDAMGVLAGRYKRRWKVRASAGDADRALQLYTKAYDLTAPRDPDQAHYHGINVAFMQLAYQNDREAAWKKAARVLEHCAASVRERRWTLASEAEAHLYLGQEDRALAKYREALVTPVGTAHDLERQNLSMYQQAVRVAAELGDRDLARHLDELFRGEDGS